MAIKFFIQLFKDKNFAGKSRDAVSNEADLRLIGFNNDVSSLKIMRGPDYQPGDVVRLYENDEFRGTYIELGPGEFPDADASPIHMDNRISSLAITNVHVPEAPPVPLIVQIFHGANFEGKHRTLVHDETDLRLQDFDDETTSLQVFAGPAHAGHVATFYQNPNFSGFTLEPAEMGPGTSIPNLKAVPNKLNNRISSVRIHLPGK